MCSDMVQLLLLIMAAHCTITREKVVRRQISGSVQEALINDNIAYCQYCLLKERKFYWMSVGAPPVASTTPFQISY